jgi:diguanylate cyclase (GGDEF)-like protein
MPIPATKILLIEDNPGDARLILETLAESPGFTFEITCCESVTEALEALLRAKPGVILSDLGLPDSQAGQTVETIHRAAPDVPLVVLTGADEESLDVRTLQAGAQDYMVKGRIDGASVWHALRYAMERQRVQLEVLNLASIDELTGLSNRRGFLRICEHQLKLAHRTGKPFLVAFFDIDGMKEINDTFGHQEGDHAIIDTSNVLKDSLRQSDVLARLGGDEFAALVVDASGTAAETLVARIQTKLASLNATRGRIYDLSLSVGIVAGDQCQTADLEVLLSQADARMYDSKRKKNAARNM